METSTKISFYVMPFYGEAMHMRNMGMSFFVVCPYIFLICAPKIGMNRRGIVLSSSGCNSSRFSGPCTHSYVKGIPQKKTSPCSMQKKTSPYSHKSFFLNNPAAKRRFQMLCCNQYCALGKGKGQIENDTFPTRSSLQRASQLHLDQRVWWYRQAPLYHQPQSSLRFDA